jgi:hypothetical protein
MSNLLNTLQARLQSKQVATVSPDKASAIILKIFSKHGVKMQAQRWTEDGSSLGFTYVSPIASSRKTLTFVLKDGKLDVQLPYDPSFTSDAFQELTGDLAANKLPLDFNAADLEVWIKYNTGTVKAVKRSLDEYVAFMNGFASAINEVRKLSKA